MFTASDLARLANLKRNTTIIEQAAPADAGGFCAAVIDRNVQLSTWTKEQEIVIVLTAREVFELRNFLNAVVDATMTGTAYPDACLGGRK